MDLIFLATALMAFLLLSVGMGCFLVVLFGAGVLRLGVMLVSQAGRIFRNEHREGNFQEENHPVPPTLD